MDKMPNESDECLQKVTGQIFVGHATLVAYELGLFRHLAKNPRSLKEVRDEIGVGKRALQAMISSAAALGLIDSEGEKWRLSGIGKAYLDPDSSTYYGPVFDLFIQQHELMNYSSIRSALVNDKPHSFHEEPLFASENDLGSTPQFIAALHHKSLNAARIWPYHIDLTDCSLIVDIGGGSGVHTLAACQRYPDLMGLICDRPGVLSHTERYIEQAHLKDRISLFHIDMWYDSFPRGDVHFFADIFHDWRKEQCLLLAEKSFESLPRGGRIVLHEMLFSDDKSSPFLTAAYNAKMMVWTEGQQFSHREIQVLLERVGFENITFTATLGNWTLITGKKM